MLKALIISDDKGKFKDLSDVIQVARSIGRQVFKTEDHILVKQILGPFDYGYVVVIEWCSNKPGVGEKEDER